MARAIGEQDRPAVEGARDRFALIFRVDDLEETVARLRSLGIVMLDEIRDQPGWGIRTAHLRDPDGNLIELVVSLSEDRWDEGLREANERYRQPTER